MSSSIRLRRAGLVVLIAIGALSMHGLATASASEPTGEAPTVAAGTALTHTNSGHDTEGEGSHGTMHAIGQLCLWLVAGGATLIAGRTMRRIVVAFLRDTLHNATRPPAPPVPAGRSPDPALAMVALRC